MGETVTEKVKEAVLPSKETVMHYVTSGISAFTGFALSGAVGAKAEPHINRLLGGRTIPIVSPGTIVRVGTVVAMGLIHSLTRDTRIGQAGVAGIHIRDVTFWATAGAFANAFGSLIVDLLTKFGGGSDIVRRTAIWLNAMTGLSGGADSQAGAPQEAPAEAAAAPA